MCITLEEHLAVLQILFYDIQNVATGGKCDLSF